MLITTMAVGRAQADAPQTQIPSVGCPTGGQDEEPAPPDTVATVRFDPHIAQQLALYGGNVVGPRGWQCQEYVTDAGYLTLVAPKLAGNLLAQERVAGPAILVFDLDSAAFGRFEVAQIIARYFPQRIDYVRRIMAEGFLRRRDWVFHPYPVDRFIERGDRMFEVVTPPHRIGFGTGWLVPDDLPVHSRVSFFDGEEPGFFIVRAKLPPGLTDLIPVVLDQPKP